PTFLSYRADSRYSQRRLCIFRNQRIQPARISRHDRAETRVSCNQAGSRKPSEEEAANSFSEKAPCTASFWRPCSPPAATLLPGITVILVTAAPAAAVATAAIAAIAATRVTATVATAACSIGTVVPLVTLAAVAALPTTAVAALPTAAAPPTARA